MLRIVVNLLKLPTNGDVCRTSITLIERRCHLRRRACTTLELHQPAERSSSCLNRFSRAAFVARSSPLFRLVRNDLLSPQRSFHCHSILHTSHIQECPFVHHFSVVSAPPTQAELRRLLSDGFLTHEATECCVRPEPVRIDDKLHLRCSDCGFQTVII